MKVRWARLAIAQLEAISDYIAEENPGAADRLIDRIVKRVDDLVAHPHAGRPGRVAGTRELVIADSPYIVAYRVRDTVVEAVAVLHAARKWPDRFG